MPPVTAERSPPLSRMTGADSPVMAASLTEATPSITSPSAGIEVAGLDQHDVALPRARAPAPSRHVVAEAPASRLATVSVLRLAQGRGLGLAAAFGDRLGEVGEQHGEPEPQIDLERRSRCPPAPVTRSRTKRTVVSAATISTTNMTGLRTIGAGRACGSVRPAAAEDLRVASACDGRRPLALV